MKTLGTVVKALVCLAALASVVVVEGAEKSETTNSNNNNNSNNKIKTNYLLKKPECSEKNMRKIELVIAKAAVIGPRGRKLPEDFTQLKAFCKETNRLVAQVEQFTKACFEKTIRDTASVVLYTIKSNLRKYCTGKNKRKVVRQLLKLAPCANKYVQPYDHCLQGFINKTKQLVYVRNDKVKVPYGCCYFVDLVHCAEDFLTSIPCMRPHVPMLMDYYRTNSAAMHDIACGDYNDQSDACQRLGPAPKPVKENRKNYITPFTLAFDMLDNMDNFTVPMFT